MKQNAYLLRLYANADKAKERARKAETELKRGIQAYAAQNKMCVPHPDTLRANLQGR